MNFHHNGEGRYFLDSKESTQRVAQGDTALITTKSQKLVLQGDGDICSSIPKNSVLAMKQRFEQQAGGHSRSRDDVKSQRLSSRGSARGTERRKLNQPFFSPTVDTPKLAEDHSSTSTATSNIQKRENGNGISDKKKMFEGYFPQRDSFLHGVTRSATSEISHTISSTLTSSELSPLDYDGSLRSEDTVSARDEVEACRHSHVSDNRDIPMVREKVTTGGNAHNATRSFDESFRDTLNELMESFENDTKMLQEHKQLTKRRMDKSDSPEVPESHTYSNTALFVMASGRTEGGPTPVSMLTSFDSDQKGSLSSRGSLHGQGYILPKHTKRDMPPTQKVPTVALFSTVDQEKEREKAKLMRKDASKASVSECNQEAPPITEQRFEFFDDAQHQQQTHRALKGILKHNSSDVVSSISSTSWNSSGTSEQASDCQDLHQSMKMAPDNTRKSIGACINDHLAENPPGEVSTAEVSSHCSSHYQPLSDKHRGWKPERKGGSVSSSIVAKRNNLPSTPSMDAQYSINSKQDLRQLALTVSSLAQSASTVALDCFVDAADKVVVTPLITLFNCVDASESILCTGANQVGVTARGISAARKPRNLTKKTSNKGNQPRFRTFGA